MAVARNCPLACIPGNNSQPPRSQQYDKLASTAQRASNAAEREHDCRAVVRLVRSAQSCYQPIHHLLGKGISLITVSGSVLFCSSCNACYLKFDKHGETFGRAASKDRINIRESACRKRNKPTRTVCMPFLVTFGVPWKNSNTFVDNFPPGVWVSGFLFEMSCLRAERSHAQVL